MNKYGIGLAVGVAMMISGTVPSMAQQRYATDPDPFVYSRLDQEHRALSHSSAVLPRSTATRSAPVAVRGPAYATDPDPFVYNRLDQEHFALSHSGSVLPRAVAGARARALGVPDGGSLSSGGVTGNYSTDPDPRIRSRLLNERNVF
ncbi:hypothetical protein [Rhodoplanes roseus]|nr:hypothetical protein [Rhodoplanes roseus]